MYASRDPRLTSRFSENFSGYTGSGDFLVTDKHEWVKITLQDFAQVSERINIEILDLSLQELSDDVLAATALFHIHLPLINPTLAHEKVRLVLIFRALEDLNGRLEVLSNTDGLTGIANRRQFDRMLAQEWDRAQRAQTPLAMIMLDIDDFKRFNDQYGHLAGDDCLKALVQSLIQTGGRRAGELAARYGGDEFVILLPDTTASGARAVARRIRRHQRAQTLSHEGCSYGSVSISLGVSSLLPSRSGAPEELVRQADSALYRAKQAGRDCVRSA